MDMEGKEAQTQALSAGSREAWREQIFPCVSVFSKFPSVIAYCLYIRENPGRSSGPREARAERADAGGTPGGPQRPLAAS